MKTTVPLALGPVEFLPWARTLAWAGLSWLDHSEVLAVFLSNGHAVSTMAMSTNSVQRCSFLHIPANVCSFLFLMMATLQG